MEVNVCGHCIVEKSFFFIVEKWWLEASYKKKKKVMIGKMILPTYSFFVWPKKFRVY